MFGAISRRYDVLNHVLSLNLDVGWRRHAASAACLEPGLSVLDLCGGTGDLSMALALGPAPPSLVVCCDFSRPMLARAVPKFARAGVDDRCVNEERCPCHAQSIAAAKITDGGLFTFPGLAAGSSTADLRPALTTCYQLAERKLSDLVMARRGGRVAGILTQKPMASLLQGTMSHPRQDTPGAC